jgi:hypothetical protein
MQESNLLMFWQIVVKLMSAIWVVVTKRLCPYHAGNCSICTLKSHNFYFDMLLILRDSNVSRFKPESSWEVFIQDSYFANCIVASESLRLSFSINNVGVVKFNEEIKIWLPLLIIHDWDLNFHFGRLVFLESYDFICFCVILWCYRSA